MFSSFWGLGEITVAFTHSIFMILCGWVFLGGDIANAFPWLVGLPMFLAVFSAITLAGVPDEKADAAAGKATLVVKSSTRVGACVALIGTLAAVGAVFAPGPTAWRHFSEVAIPTSVHGVLLIALLSRYLMQGAGCRRIDSILFAALSFVLWFSVAPLISLLRAE